MNHFVALDEASVGPTQRDILPLCSILSMVTLRQTGRETKWYIEAI